MKKLILLIATLGLFCSTSFAQSPKYVYCDLVGISKLLSLNKIKISVDYGEEQSLFKSQIVKDENGKAMTFNSMIDAMNYMAQSGWQIDACYVLAHNGEETYHWILKKEVQ